MLMLTAAFDVSVQQPENRFLIMAGFVSEADSWVAFDDDWRKRLSKDRLSYFHMQPFAQSAGPFKGWNDQEARRQSLIGDLLNIIKEHARHKFGCVVTSDSLNTLTPEAQVKLGGTMLGAAGYVIVGAVSRWRDIHKYSGNPEYVFEDGDKDKGSLTRVIKAETGVEPIYRPKKDNAAKGVQGFTPLQASDILAYEIKKLVAHYDGPLSEDFKFRFPYEELDKIPGEPKVLDKRGTEAAQQYLATIQYFEKHPLV